MSKHKKRGFLHSPAIDQQARFAQQEAIAKAERAVIEAAMADWKSRDLNEDTSALHYEGIWDACAALDKLRKGTP